MINSLRGWALNMAPRQGPEFGTNTGRQGSFNPHDPRERQMAESRAQALEQQYGQRLQPGFTGYTGLAKNDARGFSRMLNAQTEYGNILQGLQGKAPLGVAAGYDERPFTKFPGTTAAPWQQASVARPLADDEDDFWNMYGQAKRGSNPAIEALKRYGR